MPLRMRKVSYRSSTRGNDDAPRDEARDNYTQDDRDDDTRDDQVGDDDDQDNRDEPDDDDQDHTIKALDDSGHNSNNNRARNETIFELCFHDDFEASPRRPPSLHFDRTYLTYYGVPPVLEAPPPPGVIIELGRVDVLPDDPQFLAMLEGQIRREIDEDTERKSRQSFGANLVENLGLEARSETNARISAIWRDYRAAKRHRLGMPIDKTSTLELSWKLTRWLTSSVQKPISWKAWHLYQSTSQDEDASRQFFNRSLWEYGGVKFDETERLKEMVNLLSHRARNLWESIREDIFNWWVRIQIASIGRVASNVVKFIELSPEDNIFIAQDNASLSWIPAATLPKQMPRGICDILDTYRTLFLQDDHLSDSC
ncbi:hypothetical protein CEP54_014587 [Fusarium duplospermum]|uniref:Uncharacterized protein n=1 Tax=Fusarium duplospermum TaxID=1325734 RepID=A0A428NVD7_9HYPO|nr:hypothetical protein CEP54_014587 [Fusarium duplospermum]